MLHNSEAAGHSVTSNKMTRNYEGGSYSSLRTGNLDFDAALIPKKRQADKLGFWILNTIAPESVERGLLKLPASVERRWMIRTDEDRVAYFTAFQTAIMRGQFRKPQQKLIDPQKDAAGQRELEDRGYKTFDQIVGEMSGTDGATQRAAILASKNAHTDMLIAAELYEKEARERAGLAGAPTPEQLDNAGGDR